MTMLQMQMMMMTIRTIITIIIIITADVLVSVSACLYASSIRVFVCLYAVQFVCAEWVRANKAETEQLAQFHSTIVTALVVLVH